MRNIGILLILSFLSCNDTNTISSNLTLLDGSSKDTCYSGNQYEMNICAYSIFKKNDSLLNVKYNTLLGIINKEINIYKKSQDTMEYNLTKHYLEEVINSQQAWVICRNSNAKLKAKMYEGGTMHSLIFNEQKSFDTKKRIVYINELIFNFEN